MRHTKWMGDAFFNSPKRCRRCTETEAKKKRNKMCANIEEWMMIVFCALKPKRKFNLLLPFLRFYFNFRSVCLRHFCVFFFSFHNSLFVQLNWLIYALQEIDIGWFVVSNACQLRPHHQQQLIISLSLVRLFSNETKQNGIICELCINRIESKKNEWRKNGRIFSSGTKITVNYNLENVIIAI